MVTTKVNRWLILIAGVVIIGSAFGWSYFRNARPPAYQTAPVNVGDVASTVAATGSLNAVVTVQVGSQVSGNIKALYADFKTKVTKGQLVALIDPQQFQARVNQGRANLDAARASQLNAQSSVVKAEAGVSSVKASLEIVKAQLAKAEADLRDAHLLQAFFDHVLHMAPGSAEEVHQILFVSAAYRPALVVVEEEGLEDPRVIDDGPAFVE